MCIDYEEVREEAKRRARKVMAQYAGGILEYYALVYQLEHEIVEEIQEGWDE